MSTKSPLIAGRRMFLLAGSALAATTLMRSPFALADIPEAALAVDRHRHFDTFFKARPDLNILVIGVGDGGESAVDTMMAAGLEGVDFTVANIDASSAAVAGVSRRLQLGRPAEEVAADVAGLLAGYHMVFVVAGLGGKTGTVDAPFIAQQSRALGLLTVGVVIMPIAAEGELLMQGAKAGLDPMARQVDTLLVVPNESLHAAVQAVTDLLIMPGLINLDLSDVRAVMDGAGQATVGVGEAAGNDRALAAAEVAIANSTPTDVSMAAAQGVLINIVGGLDMTLFEIDQAANRIRDEAGPDTNIIFGSTFDERLNGRMRVSVVATGIA